MKNIDNIDLTVVSFISKEEYAKCIDRILTVEEHEALNKYGEIFWSFEFNCSICGNPEKVRLKFNVLRWEL